jgi:dipeptidase E
MMNRRLLLISNSTQYGSNYLDHCEDEIIKFLSNINIVLFIPYARPSGMKYEEYTKITYDRFKDMGYKIEGIHEYSNPKNAIKNADAIFIGGGNTFVLLNELYKKDLLKIIYKKTMDGMLYIGSSAGTNVACKSIKTTNDMPIVYPPSFKALNLVPFNINPHYIDVSPNGKHMGETRETRIREFHHYNNEYVVGLREGSMLLIDNNSIWLKGKNNAIIFGKNQNPINYKTGENLDFLLK